MEPTGRSCAWAPAPNSPQCAVAKASQKMSTNYLKAVFWDHPELCDPEAIKKTLDEARLRNDNKTVYWIMARFLERGRIRDTAVFFKPKQIKEELDVLKISPRARKRWKRLLEVYGNID